MNNMIIYKEFYAERFRSFCDRITFKVKPGKHLILGENKNSASATSNGSGKSSIAGIPRYAQYKKAAGTNDPSFQHKGNMLTGEVFVKDGVEYRIERYLKHKIFKNQIHLFIDGVDNTKRLKKNCNEEIEKIIGASDDVFSSTIIVRQGLPKNFCDHTETVRKSTVEEMLGFSIWTDFFKPLFDGGKKRIQQDQLRVQNDHTQNKK